MGQIVCISVIFASCMYMLLYFNCHFIYILLLYMHGMIVHVFYRVETHEHSAFSPYAMEKMITVTIKLYPHMNRYLHKWSCSSYWNWIIPGLWLWPRRDVL